MTLPSRQLRVALLFCCAACLTSVAFGQRHELVQAQDGSGVFGYKDTPVQPWSGYHVHDPDRPVPAQVDPGPAPPPAPVPNDAVVLFAGQDVSAWQTAEWTVEDGCLVAGNGTLWTKQEFGDCQLHLEWQAPDRQEENWGNRGNNGVMLLGITEIQIYDSFANKIYPDGQAAAVYAQTPPLVNACRKPGEWQSYDIFLRAPVWEGDQLAQPARLTMLHNGVLVHLDQTLYGATPHARLSSWPGPVVQGPVGLMGHHSPVRFRNIWVRPLTTTAASKL